MADEPKLFNHICKFLRSLPDVQPASKLIPFHQKVIYTAVSLFIFLAGSQLPLYGIRPATGTDPLYWVRLAFASNRDTLMTLGITPILVSEIIMQLLMRLKVVDVNNSTPKAHMLLNKAQKLLGVLVTILQAIIYVLCSPGSGNAVLIMLQILFSGIVVIYLDDVLKKGYGLLSSISLFTASNICGNVLWKAFSPNYVIYHEQDAEFEGAVIAWIHLLITRTDILSALHKAFCRRNLPNVIDLLVTCLFFLIAILFHGISVVLPVRTIDHPEFQVNCSIKLSNISYAPAIFCHALISCLYIISELMSVKYGVNLLGKWKRSKHFGQFIPVGGIVHYKKVPPTLADLHRDPITASLYIILVLSACAYLCKAWFRAFASSRRLLVGLVGENDQELMLAQPDSLSPHNFKSHVAKIACFGGFCVGALIIWADLIGVIGSGTGIMVAVSVVYPYFAGRGSEVGVFGL